jgi:chorismate mutase-like protein
VSLPGLDELRAAIDDVDLQLLQLLRQRVELVLKVGEIKRANGMRVYDPERERHILEFLSSQAQWPLQADRARRIFERIIDESRSQEQQHISERPGS